MYRKNIVPPEDYLRLLQELSDEADSENSDNASDVDEAEVIEHSDHASDSEIDGNVSNQPNFTSSNDVSPTNDDFSDVEIGESDLKCKDFFVKTIYQKKKVGGKMLKEVKEIYKWNKVPLKSKFARTPKKNLMKKILPTLKNCDDINDEISAFQKIINTNMIDALVEYTNTYLKCKRAVHDPQTISKRSMYDTNRAELLAFLGILILLGCKKMSKLNLEEAWAKDGTGIEILQGVMGLKRFRNLCAAIRFDDKDTRYLRRKTDKLAAVREFFESFNQNCQSFYTPGDELTIDEKLEPFRGRCSFIQYIPNKPAKYGMKIFAIVDSRTFYTLKLEIYCGKQPIGPNEISNSSIDIVKKLIGAYKGSNCNLTTDNWYTSYPLAQYLLSKGITLVGTLKKNKREIPDEFHPSKSREVGSSLFGFQKDMTLVSYVTKKNKCVILLSTSHDDDKIDPATNKPQMILDYNKYKGGVDTVDQLCGNFTVVRKTTRWTMAIFFALLNIAGINSQVLLNFAKPDATTKFRRYFLKNLATSLMKQHLQNRLTLPFLAAHSKAIIRRLVRGEANETAENNEEPPVKK